MLQIFSRHLRKKKYVKVINAVKISAIAENLVKDRSCAKNYNLDKFKTI